MKLNEIGHSVFDLQFTSDLKYCHLTRLQTCVKWNFMKVFPTVDKEEERKKNLCNLVCDSFDISFL